MIAGGPAPLIATALLAALGSGYVIALYIAAGQTVNIYFDSPEACDQPPGTLPADDPTYGTTQLYMESNTRISANSASSSARLIEASVEKRKG